MAIDGDRDVTVDRGDVDDGDRVGVAARPAADAGAGALAVESALRTVARMSPKSGFAVTINGGTNVTLRMVPLWLMSWASPTSAGSRPRGMSVEASFFAALASAW